MWMVLQYLNYFMIHDIAFLKHFWCFKILHFLGLKRLVFLFSNAITCPLRLRGLPTPAVAEV